MGKVRKQHRRQKFNYDQNRRKLWKKSKKLPHIECDQIRKAWDAKKSVQANLTEMGISADPNKTIKNQVVKEQIEDTSFLQKTKSRVSKAKQIKKNVVQELEAEASIPTERTLRLSEPEVRYCTYMMEKYGEDYKAMARDSRNHFQDTPKQIKRKIQVFKSIPEQYNEYLSKGMVHHSSGTHEDSDTMAPSTPPCRPHPLKPPVIARKATRTYRAKRRNGHYLTPSIGDTPGTRQTKSRTGPSEVQYHKIRRRLQFGRKPPTSRHSEDLHTKFEASGTIVEMMDGVQDEVKMQNSKVLQRAVSKSDYTVTRGRKGIVSKERVKLSDKSDSTVLPLRLRSSKLNADLNLGQGSVSPERNKGRQN